MIHILGLCCGLFNPTVRISSGRQVVLQGRGPPVVFATGLFGSVSRRCYTQLIAELANNLTVVSMNDIGTLCTKDVEDIADSLEVSSVGFFSHSSFDKTILMSKRVNRAFLCDPITPPYTNNVVPDTQYGVSCPTYIIQAEKAYLAKLPIPKYFALEMDNIQETYVGVGHTDILDDTWADICKQIGFWEVADVQNKRAFEDWTLDDFQRSNPEQTTRRVRQTYRTHLAKSAIDFFTVPNMLTTFSYYG
tara:strand:- start:89 stop:832 length:744 start_codon:yes stop_codon:yes gene_type:complete